MSETAPLLTGGCHSSTGRFTSSHIFFFFFFKSMDTDLPLTVSQTGKPQKESGRGGESHGFPFSDRIILCTTVWPRAELSSSHSLLAFRSLTTCK